MCGERGIHGARTGDKLRPKGGFRSTMAARALIIVSENVPAMLMDFG